MRPPLENLEAVHTVTAQVDQRLKVWADRMGRDGLPDVHFQFGLAPQFLPHALFEELESDRRLCFCAVHRGIRRANQRIGILAVSPEQRDADTATDLDAAMA